jgi:hypothetical protein
MRPALLVLVVLAGCGSGGAAAPGGSGGVSGTGGAAAPDAAAGSGGDASAGSGGVDGGGGGVVPDAGPDRGFMSPPDGYAGDCVQDSDCPTVAGVDQPLLCQLGPDGFHHCKLPFVPPLQACPAPNPDPSFLCCRSDAQCTQQPHGHCLPFSHRYCGGPPPLPGNFCRYDACTRDSDCTAMANGFCTANFERSCVYGPCRTNADCTRGPRGRCVMDTLNSGYCPREVVFCSYEGDPCRSDRDCKGVSLNGMICAPRPDLHGTVCIDRGPPPP